MEEKKAAEEKGITDQQFADLLIYWLWAGLKL